MYEGIFALAPTTPGGHHGAWYRREDKFKGTLTAWQAAKAISRGWKTARPEDKLTQLPISDGGDGFGQLMANALHASPITIVSKDAAGNKIEASIWQTNDRVTLIESANLIGLSMLPKEQRNPFTVDSTGPAESGPAEPSELSIATFAL